MDIPLPIEQTDPEFAKLLKWYCNSDLRKQGIIIDMISNNIPFVKKKKIKRNDSCSCNSGKKYKKCCGRVV